MGWGEYDSSTWGEFDQIHYACREISQWNLRTINHTNTKNRTNVILFCFRVKQSQKYQIFGLQRGIRFPEYDGH
jgi:hypothetical protein